LMDALISWVSAVEQVSSKQRASSCFMVMKGSG
jgi:hypothetical protein